MMGDSNFFPSGQVIQVKLGQADRLGGTCPLSIQPWLLHQLMPPRTTLAWGPFLCHTVGSAGQSNSKGKTQSGRTLEVWAKAPLP